MVNRDGASLTCLTDIYCVSIIFLLLRWLSGKESTCQCRRLGFDPWVRKIPWRRKWQSTPVFFSGKSHGQRSLAGYSPWGHKELDTTQQLSNNDNCIFRYQGLKEKWCKSSSFKKRIVFAIHGEIFGPNWEREAGKERQEEGERERKGEQERQRQRETERNYISPYFSLKVSFQSPVAFTFYRFPTVEQVITNLEGLHVSSLQ